MAKTKLQKAQLFESYLKILESGNFFLIKLNKNLPAFSINEYRKYLNENNSSMHLLKNKVFIKAVETNKLYAEFFKGFAFDSNIAIVQAEDIIIALKGLDKMQESAKELLALRGKEEDEVKKYKSHELVAGVVAGNIVEKQDLNMLATLPGVDALYGMLAGGLKNVLSGFVSVLSGNIRNLAYALNQVVESKK